jgi:hypothetical protein
MNDAERIRVALANDVAALLGGGLQGELVDKLAASPRFAARLHAAAQRQLGELSAPAPAATRSHRTACPASCCVPAPSGMRPPSRLSSTHRRAAV